MPKRSAPSKPFRPASETVLKTAAQEATESKIPVVDDVARIPRPEVRELPTKYVMGARVVVPDYGHRHGEIVDSEGGVLTIRLDGTVLSPESEPGRPVKTRTIQVEKDRTRLTAEPGRLDRAEDLLEVRERLGEAELENQRLRAELEEAKKGKK